MGSYLAHLESIHSSKAFGRKLRYIEHNFGRLLRPGMTVLEAGPGLGEFLAVLNRRGISDIDIVERDAGVAGRLAQRFEVRNRWIMPLENLAAAAGELRRYDLIYLSQILEHVRKDALAPALGLLYAHLKPGGRIVAVVPNGGNPLCSVERYADLTHEGVFSPNALRQLVEQAGLEGCGIEIRGYRIPPSTPVNWIRIAAQKIVHGFLLALMAANGGNYCTLLHPNISLIVTRCVSGTEGRRGPGGSLRDN